MSYFWTCSSVSSLATILISSKRDGTLLWSYNVRYFLFQVKEDEQRVHIWKSLFQKRKEMRGQDEKLVKRIKGAGQMIMLQKQKHVLQLENGRPSSMVLGEIAHLLLLLLLLLCFSGNSVLFKCTCFFFITATLKRHLNGVLRLFFSCIAIFLNLMDSSRASFNFLFICHFFKI